MGQALYRKYRPRSFSEAVGQEAITKTLAEAIKTGRISHAYLFAGPRGVGKTSIARILAHEVNNLLYRHDKVHLDIIEIDAASNRRIDEIRDLREKVHITPTSAKYKVYIIDEVHMLTKEAFNALLKTLEEPPAHCIFILATTEAHKLPETITSRTQRFNFRPIGKEVAKAYLAKIAKSEKIDVDDEALSLLADFGEGSLRDIISLLDQLGAIGKKITEKEARDLLGVPPPTAIYELAKAISNGDPQDSLKTTDYLKEQASNPVVVAKALAQNLRKRYLEQGIGGSWLTDLLRELVNVSASPNPQETLELAVLEAASRRSDFHHTESTPPAEPSGTISRPKTSRPQKPTINQQFATKSEIPLKQFSLEQWPELLRRVRTEVPSLYTALRLAEPTLNAERLNLAFPFALHQKKVKEAKLSQIIVRLIEEISGAKVVISCVVDRELTEKRRPDLEAPAITDLKTINNIFGSAEVLES